MRTLSRTHNRMEDAAPPITVLSIMAMIGGLLASEITGNTTFVMASIGILTITLTYLAIGIILCIITHGGQRD